MLFVVLFAITYYIAHCCELYCNSSHSNTDQLFSTIQHPKKTCKHHNREHSNAKTKHNKAQQQTTTTTNHSNTTKRGIHTSWVCATTCTLIGPASGSCGAVLSSGMRSLKSSGDLPKQHGEHNSTYSTTVKHNNSTSPNSTNRSPKYRNNNQAQHNNIQEQQQSTYN